MNVQNPRPVLHLGGVRRPEPTLLTRVVLAFVLLHVLERSLQCRVALGFTRTIAAMHVRRVRHTASSSEGNFERLYRVFFLVFFIFYFYFMCEMPL